MNFDFIFKFFLQRKKIYALKLIVALNFSLLRHDIFLRPSLRRIPIEQMQVMWLMKFAGK